MKRVRLTKTVADSARYRGRSYEGADGKLVHARCVLWDAEQRGFGLRVTPAGDKVFVVKFAVNGRSRVMALGRYGELTVGEARERAAKVRGKASDGRDVLAERQEKLRAKRVHEVVADFLAVPRKANTARSYRQALGHVVKRLGTRKLADLTRQDVRRLHAALARRPYVANRAVAALSAMFSFAENAGIVTSNPALRAVKRNPEPARQRFLAPAEIARLGAVLSEMEPQEGPYVVGAIRFLLLVGCRVGEALGARWNDIDLAAGRWHLRDAKGGPRVVYLSAAALQLLAGLPREAGAGGAFVFPSPSREGQPRATLAKPWERIRKRLGWPDLRLHDLRRSHGALAVAGGESLLITSRLLGHKSQAVTDRVYAPLAADPAAAAAARVQGAMAAALAGGELAPVLDADALDFERRRRAQGGTFPVRLEVMPPDWQPPADLAPPRGRQRPPRPRSRSVRGGKR